MDELRRARAINKLRDLNGPAWSCGPDVATETLEAMIKRIETTRELKKLKARLRYIQRKQKGQS